MNKLDTKPSSNIDQAHYDHAAQTLKVHFKNGGVYVYSNVSPQAADAFQNAQSAGKHLISSIVGKYPVRKV